MNKEINKKEWSDSDIIVLDDERLREYQLVLLDMLQDIVSVFEKQGIGYTLVGGSILGAVRHQGFIPWDDDIDLAIPRKDYNKLLDIFEKELGENYYIQTPSNTPELGLLLTQIRKKNTVARRKYDWNIDKCGISIDLFILENVYDNPIKRFFQKNISMALTFAVSSVREVRNKNIPMAIQQLEGRKWNYTRSKKIVGSVLGCIPIDKWIHWTEYWFSICKDKNTEWVAIPSGRKHFNGETYKREDMCRFKKVPFENTEFNVPVWAIGFLEKFYGDYMAIPPVEKRERHIFLELKY